MSTKANQSWIDAGYELFSHEGQDGIQIERLARILDLNKSGFYHYFGDRNIYFEHLMHHHRGMADRLLKEISTITSYDPDFLQLVVKYKLLAMVQMQLVRNRHIPLFANTFLEISHSIDRATLPFWAELVGLEDQHNLAMRSYEMVRDSFFSRVSYSNFNYDFLHNHITEAKATIEELSRNERILKDSSFS